MTACEVHHVLEGPEDAPALVLVNSLGATLEMWQPQAEALRGSFRVVRYDCRGHGRSSVPPGPYELADLGADLLALLDRLGLERASLAGVSLGGATALWVAANAPERVERLIPCFTAADFGPVEPWLDRAELVREHGTATVAATVAGRWFTPEFAAREERVVARMEEMIASTPSAGYAACCEAVGRYDLRADLARISAPTLVLSGGEDPASPPAMGRAIAAGIPGARFALVEGVAHLGNYERPDRVTDLIRGHLEGESP